MRRQTHSWKLVLVSILIAPFILAGVLVITFGQAARPAAYRGEPVTRVALSLPRLNLNPLNLPSPTPSPTPKAAGGGRFPRPPGDNGRGVHWFPNTSQSREVVDRYVPELERLRIKWVLIVAGTDRYDRFAHDYLVQALRRRGIEPILRVGGRVGPSTELVKAQAEHYVPLGVRYFQIFNEPNTPHEWGLPGRPSAKAYASAWLPAARAVVHAGGYPGIGALDPLGGVDDLVFLREALRQLRAHPDVSARTWIAVHNYTPTWRRGRDFLSDQGGFALFVAYDRVAVSILGSRRPVLATEGGISSYDPLWKENFAAAAQLQADWIGAGFDYLPRRPSYFYCYCPWLLGNKVGGSQDPDWEAGAWFGEDGERPVVGRLR